MISTRGLLFQRASHFKRDESLPELYIIQKHKNYVALFDSVVRLVEYRYCPFFSSSLRVTLCFRNLSIDSWMSTKFSSPHHILSFSTEIFIENCGDTSSYTARNPFSKNVTIHALLSVYDICLSTRIRSFTVLCNGFPNTNVFLFTKQMFMIHLKHSIYKICVVECKRARPLDHE